MKETKTCNKCGEEKPKEAFEPRRRTCRACRSKERQDRADNKALPDRHADVPRIDPQIPEADYSKDPLAPLKKDFRKFLWYVWREIGLPEPTPVQLDIAMFLQHGPKKIGIEAFRGVGKSFITSAYVVWELLRDPQKKILVVSASKNRADNFTIFTLSLINELEVLKHLRPKSNQRQSKIEFDVGPAIADQSPSVKSVGITGQITGTRADIIIADDVEVPNNSATADMREKLLERTREFSAILKPLPDAKTIYLGTPQTEDSIYNKLPETFTVRIWPAQLPSAKEAETYGDRLAPYVRQLMKEGQAGDPVDPRRFTIFDLSERQAEYGKAGYALQFMLNTQLSDLERYPLKVKDLVIMPLDKEKAPMVVNWMPDPEKVCKELPNLAMAGDRFYWSHSVSTEFHEYTGSVLAIDPSGRGKDETGYAVVKMLNGYLFVTQAGGLQGGYDDATLAKLADIAKQEKVNLVIYESNFGDGMFGALFQPVLNRVYPCMVEEVRHSIQKEKRIIDTLEPVMARHKLVVDPKVIDNDYKTAQSYDAENKFQKTLVYQMTRITFDRGALKHDDRLDALAIAVNYWVEQMSQDELRGLQERRDELLDRELAKFMEHALGSRYSGSESMSVLDLRPF